MTQQVKSSKKVGKHTLPKTQTVLKHNDLLQLTALLDNIFDCRGLNSCLVLNYRLQLFSETTYYPVDVELYASQSHITLTQAYNDLKELVYKFRTMSYELTLDDGSVVNSPLIYNFRYNDAFKTIEVQWTSAMIPLISGEMPKGKYHIYNANLSKVSSKSTFAMLELIDLHWYRLSREGSIVLSTETIRKATNTLDSYSEFAELNRNIIKPALASVLELKGVELECKGNKYAVTLRTKAIAEDISS